MAPLAKVDLIVGIDFGMTCSGVAYARPNMMSPRLIQEWPGKPGEYHNKVPSQLLYGKDEAVKLWGFNCQSSHNTKEWFKRYLDETKFNDDIAKHHELNIPGQEPPYASIDEVRKCYQDYMKCLYNHISEKIQKNDSWKYKRVEFIFSLPTTFTTPKITNSLQPLLENAGFGTGGKNHSVSFGLTEPQASAVYTAIDQTIDFEDKDIMLVCDAGGGTTDIAILQKVGGDDDGTQLKELIPVAGYNFGSTNIDEAFSILVEERLKGTGLGLNDNTAWTMMHSAEFQTWKHAFGTLDEQQFKQMPVRVPRLKNTIKNEKAGIEAGSMMFSHDDFRRLFDAEVSKMIEYITNQMEMMRRKHDNKVIDYLVLSGGLGGSAYVRECLKKAFTGDNAHRAAPSLKVIAAANDEPQLAVVKGLVWDQMQRQKTGKAVLTERIARASYGVVCHVEYDAKLDIDQVPYEDPLDGKLRIKDHVKWVIKKDNSISTDNDKSFQFSRRFGRESPRIWKSIIVICHNDPDDLPSTLNEDVIPLAEVESDLSKVSIDKFTERQGKRKMLGLKSRKTYYEARYDVKFIIGAATDARFELWFQGQQWTAHNAIKIDWQEGENVPAHPGEATSKKVYNPGKSRRNYEWD